MDIEQTVEKNLFFSTYEYDVLGKINQKVLYLWGNSKTNQLLVQSLKNKCKEVVICLEEKTSGIHYKDCRVEYFDEVNLENFDKQSVHIIHRESFSTTFLNKISNFFIKEKQVALFYGSSLKELIIGPLVVDESCSNQDFENQFSYVKGYLSETLAFIASGFLVRIVYFLMMDSLEYLGEDAQLPINSVFLINRYTLEGSTQKIWRGYSNENKG